VTLDAPTFERTLQLHRGFGRVFCDWRPRTHVGEPAVDELDEYIATVLGEVHDEQWTRGGYRQVSERYARQLATFWLARNLADAELPAVTEPASPILEPFFGLFTASPAFFTNAAKEAPANGVPPSFMTKTLLDWDAGIVAVDEHTIGAVWFADED
jgi:hypothetical protein